MRMITLLVVGFAVLAAALLLRHPAYFPAQTSSDSSVASVASVSSSSSSSAEFILPIADVDWRSEEGVAVFYFLQRGIIMGYPDPGGDPLKATFRGSEPISRAEAAKILLAAGRIPLTETQNNSRFLDVAEEEWYTPYIMTAAARGIITGYPPRHILFAPRNPVTAAEFLKMLTLTFNLRERQRHNFRDVPAEAWFAPYAGVAWQYKLFPERVERLRPDSPLARRDVILALYHLFTAQRPRGVSEWFAPNIPGVPITTIPMHAPSFTGKCPPAPICPPPPEPECRYIVELDRNDCAVSCGELYCPKPQSSASSIYRQSSAASSGVGGIATANLFVTQDSVPLRNRSLLAGETGDAILRIRLRCTGQENVAVTFLKFTSAGGPANSIDRLLLYKEGETQPFAPATVAACGSDAAPAQDGGAAVRNFCASLTTEIITLNCEQDGYGGLTQALIVRPVIKALNDGAVSGETIRLFVSENSTHTAIQARGLTTGSPLGQNDGNTTANGEIFITPNAGSIPTAMANARITGYPNVVVLSKIITIANGNPAPNGTAIPSGISPFGQFTFTAAANQNGKNVTLRNIIININAEDVALDAASFKFFNKSDSTTKAPCAAKQADGTPINGSAMGAFLVECQNISAVMNTVITSGSSQSFALEGTITANNVSAAPSSLQATIKNISAFVLDTLPSSFGVSNSHIKWSDGSTEFFWFDLPETVYRSTFYSFPN